MLIGCGYVRRCCRIGTMRKKIGQAVSLFDATQKILWTVAVGSPLVAAVWWLLWVPPEDGSSLVSLVPFVAAGLFLFCGMILTFRQRAQVRGHSKGLANLAREMGWSFSDEDNYLRSNLWGFELSKEAYGRVGREIADVLDPGSGKLESGQEYEVRMFRFWQNQEQNDSATFSPMNTKSGEMAAQTVIWFRSPQLSLPGFVMRPEHVFHKIGSAFGY